MLEWNIAFFYRYIPVELESETTFLVEEQGKNVVDKKKIITCNRSIEKDYKFGNLQLSTALSSVTEVLKKLIQILKLKAQSLYL